MSHPANRIRPAAAQAAPGRSLGCRAAASRRGFASVGSDPVCDNSAERLDQESGSPSVRADGADPVPDDPHRWELCGSLTIILVLFWFLAMWLVTP